MFLAAEQLDNPESCASLISAAWALDDVDYNGDGSSPVALWRNVKECSVVVFDKGEFLSAVFTPALSEEFKTMTKQHEHSDNMKHSADKMRGLCSF